MIIERACLILIYCGAILDRTALYTIRMVLEICHSDVLLRNEKYQSIKYQVIERQVKGMIKKVDLSEVTSMEEAVTPAFPLLKLITGAACGVACCGAACGGWCGGAACAGW